MPHFVHGAFQSPLGDLKQVDASVQPLVSRFEAGHNVLVATQLPVIGDAGTVENDDGVGVSAPRFGTAARLAVLARQPLSGLGTGGADELIILKKLLSEPDAERTITQGLGESLLTRGLDTG